MYDIYMRNYPQPDVNISEEWELGHKTLKEALRLIHQMEIDYADKNWQGHKMYKAKFYPMEVTK